jgi:hypothetical protein
MEIAAARAVPPPLRLAESGWRDDELAFAPTKALRGSHSAVPAWTHSRSRADIQGIPGYLPPPRVLLSSRLSGSWTEAMWRASRAAGLGGGFW